MAKGHWSFLHEWVIYDYLKARSEERTLRFKQISSSGKLLGKPKWVKVESMNPITGTTFPDVHGIKLKGESTFRPAEVKFTTSLFNYHADQKYIEKFLNFIERRGFILVASHDYLPTNNLINLYPDIEVFEIEIEDFITFCRENFSRLLNRQIKAHSISRVWLMYQGPNFNEGFDKVPPARESLIWCPTENLTGFDLAPGDRVLFYKTSGLDRIKLQNRLLKESVMDSRWILREIYVAEVKSKIFSRYEYHQYKKHKEARQLWKNDPQQNVDWRWNRVFEFSKINVIKINKPMHEIYTHSQGKAFASRAWEAFCFGKSREISLKEYRNFLEILSD
jgi:hypothetical protein